MTWLFTWKAAISTCCRRKHRTHKISSFLCRKGWHLTIAGCFFYSPSFCTQRAYLPFPSQHPNFGQTLNFEPWILWPTSLCFRKLIEPKKREEKKPIYSPTTFVCVRTLWKLLPLSSFIMHNFSISWWHVGNIKRTHLLFSQKGVVLYC